MKQIRVIEYIDNSQDNIIVDCFKAKEPIIVKGLFLDQPIDKIKSPIELIKSFGETQVSIQPEYAESYRKTNNYFDGNNTYNTSLKEYLDLLNQYIIIRLSIYWPGL